MIKKRGKDSWLIQIYLGRDENGKKQYHNETFHSPLKSLAKQREAELNVNLKRTIGPKNSIRTVGELLDKWLTTVKSTKKAERTIEVYDWHVRRLKPVVGRLNLWGLTAFQVQEAIEGQFDDVSDRTRKNFYSTLRTVLRQGFGWGLLSSDVSTGIMMPEVDVPEKAILTFEQILALLEVIKSYKHHLVLRLLIVTGARLGEIVGLKWKDLDLDSETMRIDRAADTRNRKLNNKPKTRSSKRRIILDSETIDFLKKLKDKQMAEETVVPLNREDREDRLVFKADDGRPLRHRSIELTLKRALKKGDLPEVSVHGLRHSVLTILADNDASLTALLALSGHANLSSAEPYLHRSRKGLNVLDSMRQD